MKKKKNNIKKVSKNKLKKIKGGRREISAQAQTSALKEIEANNVKGSVLYHIDIKKPE